MKKKCAIEAANMIKDGMIVGLGGGSTERMCANKTGLTITDDGNYLMEAKFSEKPDIEKLDAQLK